MRVVLPKLEPWQKDLFDSYLEFPKGKWIVVKASRQKGKSVCMECLLVYISLEAANRFSLFVSPVILQARKVFQDICKMASKVIKSANASLLEIEFINGSVVKFGSAAQADSLRGFTVTGVLVIDEALAISDEVFYQILVPTTNVHKADIFIISTPRQKQGFFYDLYMQGFDSEKVISKDWNQWDTSKYLPPETLELYRQQMPKLAFRSEILGEFIDSESTVFGEYSECINNTEINYNKPVYIGIDWGSGGGLDNTAITIAQLEESGLVVRRIDAFNDKNVQDTINYIVNLTREFTDKVTVTVETNSIGKVYLQVLRQALDSKVFLTLFTTTNKSKDRAIKRLAVCFEQRKITIPNDQKLINELNVYECKPSPTGLPTYNARSGFKDDRVMSLAFIVDKLYLEI